MLRPSKKLSGPKEKFNFSKITFRISRLIGNVRRGAWRRSTETKVSRIRREPLRVKSKKCRIFWIAKKCLSRKRRQNMRKIVTGGRESVWRIYAERQSLQTG